MAIRGAAAGRPVAEREEWLTEVAESACREVGDVPAELLGDYLRLLAEAAITGRKPAHDEFEAVRALGRRAAEQGVPAGSAVHLYLCAARRLWTQLPTAVRSRGGPAVREATAAMLHVVDTAVVELADGYTDTRRQTARRDAHARREFVEDLLGGKGDASDLVERAAQFGLDLARPHRVALTAAIGRLRDTERVGTSLEQAIANRIGDDDVVVAAIGSRIVVLAAADAGELTGTGTHAAPSRLGELIRAELGKVVAGRAHRVALGRPYPGSRGITRSYQEAREGLTTATRLGLDNPVIQPHEVLAYRVLLRDQAAIADLVESTLGPLENARGGAEPLLATLDAYFATGAVTTMTARRLRLSVRAVTYRLDRIRTLTGHDPVDPAQRFALQSAVLGARMLGWHRFDGVSAARSR